MSWSVYGSFLVFAVVLTLVPGPDFAVVVKNTVAGGRARGFWTSAGVSSSNVVQGVAAAAGLGAVVTRSQPLFEAIRWAGIAYLLFLGVQAFRSAVIGRYPSFETRPAGRRAALAGWRQGFLSNITNPKVLVFYLAVLPQFLGSDTAFPALMALALSHAAISFVYLVILVALMHRARAVLARRRVRRTLDVLTGSALIGFGAKLALE